MVRRLSILLCFFAWSLQISVFLQPTDGTQFCQEIPTTHQHHIKKITHSCLICWLHSHIPIFPEIPSFWQKIWSYFIVLVFIALYIVVLYPLQRYIRPPSQAPPHHMDYLKSSKLNILRLSYEY